MRSQVLELNNLVEEIVQECESLNIAVSSIHVSGVSNTIADDLSRFIDKQDWALNPEVFQALQVTWGPFTIDRFATWRNAKLPRYNSAMYDPETQAVNAFEQNWKWDPDNAQTRENNYWNPPFDLMQETLQQITQQRASGTLIAPWWPQHTWFKILRQLAAESIELPSQTDLFLPASFGNRIPQGKPPWPIFAWRIWYD
jgi:hypothetical protein